MAFVYTRVPAAAVNKKSHPVYDGMALINSNGDSVYLIRMSFVEYTLSLFLMIQKWVPEASPAALSSSL